MTVEKKERRQAIDQAVNAHFVTEEIPVNTGEKLKRRAADRGRVGKRASWDLYPDIKDAVDALAAELDTSKSQAACYLIAAGLIAIQKGIVTHPENTKRPARALKYDYDLQIPDVLKISELRRHH